MSQLSIVPPGQAHSATASITTTRPRVMSLPPHSTVPSSVPTANSSKVTIAAATPPSPIRISSGRLNPRGRTVASVTYENNPHSTASASVHRSLASQVERCGLDVVTSATSLGYPTTMHWVNLTPPRII